MSKEFAQFTVLGTKILIPVRNIDRIGKYDEGTSRILLCTPIQGQYFLYVEESIDMCEKILNGIETPETTTFVEFQDHKSRMVVLRPCDVETVCEHPDKQGAVLIAGRNFGGLIVNLPIKEVMEKLGIVTKK